MVSTEPAAGQAPEFVKQHFIGGEGMSDFLNNDTVEYLVRTARSGGNEDISPLKFDTIVIADEGKTISGEELGRLIDEAKDKGVTFASLVSKLKNVRAQTIVTPGPGVVEQAPRSGRSRRPK